MLPLKRENLYENKVHGSLLFPFQHYKMFTDTCNIFVPYHWHEEVEISLCTEGHGELLIDGVRHLLTPGDLYFVNSRQLHQYTSLSNRLAYDTYIFPLSSLEFRNEDLTQSSLIRPLQNRELYFPTRLSEESPAYPSIRRLFEQILRVNTAGKEGFQLLTKAYLYEIIALLSEARLFTGRSVPRRDMDTCKKILLYIDGHYQERITVAQIAAQLCMSPNYFSAYFTRHFGKNFTDFLIRYRIEKACILFSTVDCSVTQAALQTGFENVSYFIKKFKAVTGQTPAVYRKSVFHALF